MDKERLEEVLISTRSAYRAAKFLGIEAKTVYNWMRRFGMIEQDGKIRVRKIIVRLREKRSTLNTL